jgi:hypothetical protein
VSSGAIRCERGRRHFFAAENPGITALISYFTIVEWMPRGRAARGWAPSRQAGTIRTVHFSGIDLVEWVARMPPMGDHGNPTEHCYEEARVAETLKKGSRVTGAAREKLAAELKKKYDSGASIRALAEETGRSYGFVHRMLSESGVTLRGRGGATRGKAKTAAIAGS